MVNTNSGKKKTALTKNYLTFLAQSADILIYCHGGWVQTARMNTLTNSQLLYLTSTVDISCIISTDKSTL